jgi:ABC-2 type transport system ATP-binding protein
VVVEDVQPQEIEAVVAVLADAGVAYDGLEWRRPALEDAYLAIADDYDAAIATGSSPTATVESTTGGELP